MLFVKIFLIYLEKVFDMYSPLAPIRMNTEYLSGTANRNIQENFDKIEFLFNGVFNVKDYGALGDNSTDDTLAIQAAIDAASAAGGGRVTLPKGIYKLTHIEIPSLVQLGADVFGTVELIQIAGTNADFVTSKNFSVLVGTSAYYPNDTRVPYWFGIHNLVINGNRTGGNTSGRAACFFGGGLMMSGTNLIMDAAGDCLHTEASGSAWFDASWKDQEEAYIDTVFIRQGGGKGWYFRGPHNARINTVNIILSEDSSDYGWYSDNGATYAGATDNIGQIHVYSSSSNTVNRRGMYFAALTNVDFLYGDATSIVFAAGSSGSMIDRIFFNGIGVYTGFDGLTISTNLITINSMYGSTSSFVSATNADVLNISGSFNSIGTFRAYENSSQPGNCAARITGSSNMISQAFITNFHNTSGIGLSLTGNNNSILATTIQDCKTAIEYTPGTYNIVEAAIYLNSGQTSLSTPAGTTDSFQITESGTGALDKFNIKDLISVNEATSLMNVSTAISGDTRSNGALKFSGETSLITPITVTASTTEVILGELIGRVKAGKKYYFEAKLFYDADVTGGTSFTVWGPPTTGSVLYQIMSFDNATRATNICSRKTALGAKGSQAGSVAGYAEITGYYECTTDGYISPWFAQSAASGSSTILEGSYFKVREVA